MKTLRSSRVRAPRRVNTLSLAALAFAAMLALVCFAALTVPAPTSAAPPDPVGAITVRTGNYLGGPTTETFTLEKQVFTGSTNCTSGGGATTTVSGIDKATGHSIPLASTDSVLLSMPLSSVGDGSFSSRVSEQNGPFVQWFPDAATTPLTTFLGGDGHQICIAGPVDADPHNVSANFYAGIELFDSCGNERYVFQPGESVTIRVTGALKPQIEPLPEAHRILAAGGSPNECTVVPIAPAFTTVYAATDPFVYTFTLPTSLPAYCAPFGTTDILGNYRVVAYDVPGCSCNRNDVRFKVQADAPIPSCPLTGCPADIEQAAGASCGANVNFTPPSGAPGETVTCDHTPNSFFPVGTTTVTCTGSLGGECSFDVTVNDNTPPVVTPPANISVGTDSDSCSASGINPGTATANDNCAVNVQGVRDDAQPLNAPYPLGMTTITWTATDASGNSSSAQQTVTVVDDDLPVLSAVTASPSVLWPPNHAMHDVTLSYTATDNCGNVNCAVTFVLSNEPANGTGDGDTAPDFEIVGPTLVRLRAERSGNGSGRQYMVLVTCTDGTNATTRSVEVNVPKSQKK